MNNSNSGYTLLELLVSLTILVLLLGGVCCLLLIIPQAAFHQFITALDLQNNSDYWYALERDLKNAGYGITNILPLLTFNAVSVEHFESGMNNRLNCYLNKYDAASRTVIKMSLPQEQVVIESMKNLSAGDYAVLAENEPGNMIPHWTIVAVKEIENETGNALRIHFQVVEQGPVELNDYSPGAYFVPIEKISYIFLGNEGKLERRINDNASQPFLDAVKANECGFCAGKEETVLRNCIKCSIAFYGKNTKPQYAGMIFIQNL